MLRKTLVFTLALAALLPDAVRAYTPTTLEIGAAAPDFDLPGVDGKRCSLADFKDDRLLVVIFTCNHCPDAIASYGRMNRAVEDYRSRGVGFVAISGNDNAGLRLAEMRWTVEDDGFEAMKIVAKREGFKLPYLFDGDTQVTTKAYGAVATPHVFIFDRERKLRYTGRLDDGRRNPGPAGKSEARDALDALLAGKAVPNETTRAYGCSTKWADKRDMVAEAAAEWKARKVDLAEIGPDEVKKLAANKTESLRLINVWATYCGPCLAEFPMLVETYRKFQNHDFEFITISVDSLANKKKAHDVLKRNRAAVAKRTVSLLEDQGRETNNFIFKGDDLEDLAEVLDQKWSGAQPHTMLIAPGGEVIYRHTGELDESELRGAIVKFARANWLK